MLCVFVLWPFLNVHCFFFFFSTGWKSICGRWNLICKTESWLFKSYVWLRKWFIYLDYLETVYITIVFFEPCWNPTSQIVPVFNQKKDLTALIQKFCTFFSITELNTGGEMRGGHGWGSCVSVMSDFFFFSWGVFGELIIHAWLPLYIRAPDAPMMITYMCSTDLYLQFNKH